MNVDPARLARILASAEKRLTEWGGRWVDVLGPSTEANPALPPDFGRTTDIFEYFRLGQVEYLSPGSTHLRLSQIATKEVELVKDYFFGDWRKKFPDTGTDLKEWFDELRIGLLFALQLNARKDVMKIAEFAVTTPQFDDGGWQRNRNDNNVYTWLCEAIRTEKSPPRLEVLGKRPKAIQQVILDIFDHNQLGFESSFAKYLKWYKKHDHDEEGNLLICFDGSIMLQLASFRGLRTEHIWTRDREILMGSYSEN